MVNNYKEQLKNGGVLAFVPGGNSMWPTMKNKGQSVIILPKTGRLKPLDVAFYERADSSCVLHRVLEVVEDGYIICGDSLQQREHVKEEQIFGVLSGFYRGKKYIDCSDIKYIKEVEKLYSNEKRRIRRAKWFFRFLRIKRKLKRMLGIKEKDND